jgi:hypothetical protein
MRALAVLLIPLLTTSLPLCPAEAQTTVDASWNRVATILQGSPVEAVGYVRFNFPRSDLAVRVGDVAVRPALALTTWAGFAGSSGNAVAMGDIVVTASEIGPVLEQLARANIDVTAIHNHLAGERPRISYVHFHAMGPAETIARGLDSALRRTGAPRPVKAAPPAALAIDSAAVFRTLGKSGRANGPVAQVSFILVNDTVRMGDQVLVPALSYASPINIQQVTPGRAVATGDFAIRASRLQPLLRTLAQRHITATAVHTHLVAETPQVYFVHFWGDADLPTLLAGLRAALDTVMQDDRSGEHPVHR